MLHSTFDYLMLTLAIILNVGELERVCLLMFVDRESMKCMKCNGSVQIDD